VSASSPRREFTTAALVAGVGLFGVAFLALGITPFLATGSASSRSPVPPGAAEPPAGLAGAFPDRESHVEALRRGRDLYIREACWHCHSQYVRPIPGEIARYGPVSTPGEYAHDLQLPQLFGTRRVGPDLIRESGRRSEDWHLAHLLRPRSTVDASVMPEYPWYFREFAVEAESTEDGWRLRPGPWSEHVRPAPFPRFGITPGADGRAFAGAASGTPVPVFPGEEEPEVGEVRALRLVVPTRDAWCLVAYLQSLGRHAAPLRDVSAEREGAAPPAARGRGDAARGAEVYALHCASCHGPDGDGKGPASAFLDPRPRDFRAGRFKYKTTSGARPPLDSDLFATITVGIPGTSMPGWRDLPEEVRWDLVAFVVSKDARGDGRPVPAAEDAVRVPAESTDDAASRDRGRQAFLANCASCHGTDARGSSASTSPMVDTLGYPLRARDLADVAGFRGGHASADIYRRLVIGIPGTPMPSFPGLETEGGAWDVVHYVRSLAAGAAR
jgi:cytochrome c oxidase cbb3-type subunit 2